MHRRCILTGFNFEIKVAASLKPENLSLTIHSLQKNYKIENYFQNDPNKNEKSL